MLGKFIAIEFFLIVIKKHNYTYVTYDCAFRELLLILC